MVLSTKSDLQRNQISQFQKDSCKVLNEIFEFVLQNDKRDNKGSVEKIRETMKSLFETVPRYNAFQKSGLTESDKLYIVDSIVQEMFRGLLKDSYEFLCLRRIKHTIRKGRTSLLGVSYKRPNLTTNH